MLGKKCVLAVLCVEAAIVGITDCVAADQETEAPYPTVHASADSSVVARGRYLVLHVAACGHCHSTTNGAPGPSGKVELSGGVAPQPVELRPDAASPRAPDTPAFSMGGLSGSNITSDVKTGIGAFSDAAIARTLRFGVTHDGRKVPMMNFALSDDDLTAVVSYLRTTEPVEHEMPRLEFNPPPGLFLTDKTATQAKPLKRSPRGINVVNGRYLVESVGDCGACHTARDMRTGRLRGAALSGGTSAPGTQDPLLIPANLTRGGRLATWSEKDFVARFRAGRLLADSPMAWDAFQGMHENDLRSIYRYLRSLPAAPTPEALSANN
jgi:mono/diheme cytochrome c family protein